MKQACKLFLLMLLVCSGQCLFSQQRITVDLDQRPAEELFQIVEKMSAYRIFCAPEGMDTLKVTVHAKQAEPAGVLRMALRGTPYQVTVFQNTLFILKGRQLTTGLTENYYTVEEDLPVDSVPQKVFPSAFVLEPQTDQSADSELKIYTVGNPSKKATGKVTLSGHIYDSKTGEPTPGLYVIVDHTNIVTTTDAEGYYVLSLRPGRYELKLKGIGQKDIKRYVQLYSEGRLDLQSVEKELTMKEVVVYGDRVNHSGQPVLGAQHLRMKDIKNIPTAFGESDVLKIVTALPGVKTAGEISSGFNVRGGATDQNLILYNDGMIYNPTHMFGMFSAFNPDVVKDMELYKSSIPAKYGGRISSVLDINGREGSMKEYGGTASIGLLTSRLAVEGPIVKDKGSFLLGGRTTYSDWLLGLLPEKSGYRDARAGFYDLNATITQSFNVNNKISINGYYSQDRFRFERDENYKYRNANASVKWRHFFSPKFVGTLTGGYDHYDYDTQNAVDSVSAYKLKYMIDQFYGKMDFSWTIGSKHNVDFGISSLYYDMSPGTYQPFDGRSMVLPDRLQKENALESAVYISDRWSVNSKLSFDLGFRYSVFNVLGPRTYNTYDRESLPSLPTVTETKNEGKGVLKTYHGPEFRVAARYAFSDDWSVKAGFNTMQQYIHKISNTTIMSPTDTWKLSDVNIKPQKGIQVAAGVYKSFADNMLETSVEVYYKTMKDYLDYRPGAVLVMNHHIETDVVNTNGRAYGIELMLKKTQGKLNGWVSYAYSRTQLRQIDKRITSPTNGGGWYPADFDKPHEFKFIGNYKLTHRFSFSLNCEYSTGRPITLPVSKYHYQGDEFVYYSDRNMFRVPNYFRTDISFNIEPSHHLTILTHSMFSVGIYNVTGRKNAYSVYYKTVGGRVQGYKLAIFGAPIPYVSYNIRF